MPKILVIEDQESPWENYLIILMQMCKIAKEDIERARWYSEAKAKIETGQYNIVFLDHRMPQNDPHCTDHSDFKKFSGQVEDCGYGLLPLLTEKQPNAVVIGTSSCSRDELRRYSVPDRRLDKTNMFDELPALVKSLA